MHCRSIAVLLSILLSIFILNTNNPPLQVDGIRYIAAAHAYLAHGFGAASAVFNWPFYSIVIAWVSTFTTLSLEHSAYVIDTFGVTLMVFCFITLVRELGGNTSLQLIGALLILIFPALNIMRKAPVLRDFMYWGLIFLSLWLFVRFTKTSRYRDACGFGIAVLAASLFRIEGLWIAASLPLILLTQVSLPYTARLKRLSYSYSVPVIIGLIAGLYISMHAHVFFSRPHYILIDALLRIQANLNATYNIVQEHIFAYQENRGIVSAYAMLLFGFLGVILITILSLLNYVFAFLSLQARGTGKVPPLFTRHIVDWFILVNFIMLILFTYGNFFLAERYVMPLAIAVLLYAPFSFHALYQRFRKGRYLLFVCVVVWLALLTIHGLNRARFSKAYITNAGQWLATHMNASATLYSNDAIILYYAHREDTSASHRMPQSFDYIAIQLDRHHAKEQADWERTYGKPLQRFVGPKGAVVLVFQTHEANVAPK